MPAGYGDAITATNDDGGVRRNDRDRLLAVCLRELSPDQQYSRIYRHAENSSITSISHALLAAALGTGVATGTRTPLAR